MNRLRRFASKHAVVRKVNVTLTSMHVPAAVLPARRHEEAMRICRTLVTCLFAAPFALGAVGCDTIVEKVQQKVVEKAFSVADDDSETIVMLHADTLRQRTTP